MVVVVLFFLLLLLVVRFHIFVLVVFIVFQRNLTLDFGQNWAILLFIGIGVRPS